MERGCELASRGEAEIMCRRKVESNDDGQWMKGNDGRRKMEEGEEGEKN